MSADSTSIYTGFWVNWSHGRVLGSTITLSARNSALLTSFIATFVTIVGAQLWKILCFIFHQRRTSQKPKDGLYHQQQNVFRNSSTPGGAAWSFILQSWHWSGRARHVMLRSLPWALFSVSYIFVFAALSIFGSSEVTKAAGQDRLIQSSQCGYWATNSSRNAEGDYNTQTALGAFGAKVLKDSQDASAYARKCYDGSADALGCDMYATPVIRWEGKATDCPFRDNICWRNNTYQMDTGLLDSHDDLGINTPVEERLKYRRVTTCTVLDDKGYIEQNNHSALVTWNYGPSIGQNYTTSYSKYALHSNIGYVVNTDYANAGVDSSWTPSAPLNRTDADVQMVFISANSMLYSVPVDDPVFSAHVVSGFSVRVSDSQQLVYYEADTFVSFIACAEQHQICHGDACTPLSAHSVVFSQSQGLTILQEAISQRIAFATTFTGVAQVINGRSGTALRALETAQMTQQVSLPANQWQIELSSWFNTGLVILQSVLRDYANPRNLGPGNYVRAPKTPAEVAMCSMQKTQATYGTISFSVLGLAIILVVGAIVLVISCIFETVASFIGLKSYQNWILDDKLQLQRMVFEGRGVSWLNTQGPIPVTGARERFPSVAHLPESQALIPKDSKTVGVDVTEVR
ncbi:hypothetical protein GJ744_010906 [Endocarpon pusillum]|uniref:Uncharacterized protein n=1 Tax=Endocarpon pusillum TaxID=364733 RepID=A0A8H7ADG2_9EURO|nr:hypothetical protein GJ744_010906 [Endocarpon pusillum]